MTIELEQVTKRFGGREILKNLTLDISTDTSYLITGESGSGKTTLLRILAGLEKPDEGRVRLLGDYKYTWLSCGVVFQNDRLIEYLSAVKNVSVIRKLTSDKAAREELEKLLPKDLLDCPVSELTAVQRRMVCLVRAFSVPADILLLDEPFAGMDERERSEAFTYIKEHKGSTPLVIASADPTGLETFRTIRLG